MTHLKTFLLTLTSLFFIACGAGSDAPRTSPKEGSYAVAEKTSKNEILNAINKARAVARDCQDGNGLVAPAPALIWNEELYTAAYEHSYDLATSNTFSHYGSGTSSDITGDNNQNKSYFNDRIKANGYLEYKTIGENIAGGHGSIQEAIEAWINSPAHCTNLMNPDFKEVGVAVVSNPNADYKIYWTQSFGAKK